MKNYNFILFNVLRKKKLCKFVLIIFSVATFMLLMSKCLKNGMKNKYEQIKSENIDHSYINIKSNKGYDNIINDLKKIDKVKNYYSLEYLQIDDKYIIYVDNNLINLSSGKYVIEEDEILVPYQYDKEIGDSISLNIDNKLYLFTIVGKYKINNLRFSIEHQINEPFIVSHKFISNFINKNSINEFVIIVEDYEYVDQVIVKLQEYSGYDISIYDANKVLIERYKTFSNIISMLSLIIMIFSSILIIITNCFIYYDNKNDVAILRSIGYSSNKIFMLNTFYSLLLFCLSYIPVSLIVMLLSIVFNKIFAINGNIMFNSFIYYIGIIVSSMFLINIIVNKFKVKSLLNNK